ncbi:PAS domain S-box protein [Thermodesulfobacteriota bacterium]
MNPLQLFTTAIFWLLIVLWSIILVFYLKRIRRSRTGNRLLLTLMIILAIDAFRTLFESTYFGIWYTAMAGILPRAVYTFMARPEMFMIPKILNVIAATVIIFIVILRWLPQEGREIESLEGQVEERTTDLSAANRKMAAEIAERRQAEQQLRENEERLSLALEATDAFFWELNLNTNRISVGDTAYALIGYEREELGDSLLSHRKIVDKATEDELREQTAAHIRGETPVVDCEARVRARDGQWRYIRVRAKVINGSEAQHSRVLVGTGVDVTERKKSESALRQSEDNYRSIFDASNDAIFVHDMETAAVLDVNKGMTEMFGYTLEESLHLEVADISAGVPPYTGVEVGQWIRRTLEQGPQFVEWRCKSKSGKLFWVEINLKCALMAGRERLLAVVRDISDRKEAEQALRESEEKYRGLVEASFDGIFVQKGTKIIFTNSRLREMLGYDEGELEGMEHWQVYHPDYHEITRSRALARMQGEPTVAQYDVLMQRKEGTSFDGEISAKVIELGREPGIQVWVRDITDTKRAEETLLHEKENLARIHEAMDDGVLIIAKDYNIQYANKVLRKDFGPVEGRKCYEAFNDRTAPCRNCHMEAALAGRRLRYEWHSPKTDKTYDLITTTIRYSDDGLSELQFFRDITERKRAEEQIKASLEEKEVLMREIHHRVKNNFQVVSGLLSLQSASIEDEGVLEMFRDAEVRIKAMALVHETLYESDNLAQVKIAEYVAAISSELIAQYEGRWQNISLDTDVENLSVGPDTAIPCGLIINELVTNALKHAFPDGRGGEIHIRFCSMPDDQFKLIVRDNGIGMPPDQNIEEASSLGLKLVGAFVKRLDGTMQVDSSNGTEVRIRFRDD